MQRFKNTISAIKAFGAIFIIVSLLIISSSVNIIWLFTVFIGNISILMLVMLSDIITAKKEK